MAEEHQRTALERISELHAEAEYDIAEMWENWRSPKTALDLMRRAKRCRHRAQAIARWTYERAFQLAAEAGDEGACADPHILHDVYEKAILHSEYVAQQLEFKNI